MIDKKELIVPVDPNLMLGIKFLLIMWCIPLLFLAVCYESARYYLTGTTYYIISFFIVGTFIFTCFMFLMMIFGRFFFPKKGDPVAILNKNGIWLPHFGLIPWKNITEFGPYIVPTTPPEVIAIRVNDKSLSENSCHSKKP